MVLFFRILGGGMGKLKTVEQSLIATLTFCSFIQEHPSKQGTLPNKLLFIEF